jgi:DNA repair exonuclease SbcCD nuclease subunit
MVTLICSADWQLGMRRRYFGPEAQHRYTQARLDVIERLGALAAERGADALVVAGDVFETNQVERLVISRAAESLGRVRVPVLLLPGNHDALEPGTVWSSPEWTTGVPANVAVLTEDPVVVGAGRGAVEIVGAPWRTRRPETSPTAALVDALTPGAGEVPRVLVGHGMVDSLAPTTDVPQIPLVALESALADGRLSFALLGDRHSTTDVGSTGRVWYPGTPEVTDCGEIDPGNALVVTLEGGECSVEVVHVGTWQMVQLTVELDGTHGIEKVERAIDALPDKTRTYLRLGVVGSLDVVSMTALEVLLDSLGQVFAGVSRWAPTWDVRPLPDDDALSDLGLTGAAQAAMVDLHGRARSGDQTAAGALALMHRLASGAA